MTEKELQTAIDVLKKTRNELNDKAFDSLTQQATKSFKSLKDSNSSLIFDHKDDIYTLDFKLIVDRNLKFLFGEINFLNTIIIRLETQLEWLKNNSLLSDEINNHPKDTTGDIIL